MDTVPAKCRQHLTVGALSVAATRVVPELMQHMYTYKQGTGLSSGLHLMPRGPVAQIASDVLTHFPHFQVCNAFANMHATVLTPGRRSLSAQSTGEDQQLRRQQHSDLQRRQTQQSRM